MIQIKMQKVAHFSRSLRLPTDLRKSGVLDGSGADLIPEQRRFEEDAGVVCYGIYCEADPNRSLTS